MTLAEKLNKQALEKRQQAQALASKEGVTTEELAQVDQSITEAEGLEAQAKAAEQRETRLAGNGRAIAALQAPGARRTPPDENEPIGARAAVLGDPTRGFKHLGEFALELMQCGASQHALRSNPKIMAAAGDGMSQGITADGGVLVPPAFAKQIWDGARQKSESMLGYCDVMTLDPGAQSIDISAINETSRVDGSRWGGVRGYWKGELDQLQGSKPKFRDVKFEPNELYVLGYISDKMLRNAPGLASGILIGAAADEINFKVGDGVVNGDGAGKIRGFLGHPSVVTVAKETSQVAATVVKANIDKMWARCHASWRSGAVWFVNQAVETELENLAAVVGTGGVPVYLPAGGVADTPNARLKGRPVVPIEYCAALGTEGDIVLANLKAFGVVMRGMVDQAVSMHLKFDYAQSAFRFIFEVDGQPWLASPITPYKGAATLSPIVTLATRS